MKWITVPNDIPLLEPVTKRETGKTAKFVEFVRGFLQDQRFLKTYKTVQAAARIDKALDVVAGSVASLETTDWELLKQVIEEPRDGYVGVALQVLPFMDAVIGASDEPPNGGT